MQRRSGCTPLAHMMVAQADQATGPAVDNFVRPSKICPFNGFLYAASLHQ